MAKNCGFLVNGGRTEYGDIETLDVIVPFSLGSEEESTRLK